MDSLQLTIDNIPVFIGSGNMASGRWLDVSGLNVDETNGSHEVTLSVSNSLGVATSNFAGASELPWAAVVDEITSVAISETVTVIGDNLWAGLGEGVVINGEVTTATETWRQTDIENVQKEPDGTVTLTVPVPADKGFLILKTEVRRGWR